MKMEFSAGEVLWVSTGKFMYVFQYSRPMEFHVVAIPGSVMVWTNIVDVSTPIHGKENWKISQRRSFKIDLVRKFDAGTDWLRRVYEEKLTTV